MADFFFAVAAMFLSLGLYCLHTLTAVKSILRNMQRQKKITRRFAVLDTSMAPAGVAAEAKS